MTKKLKRTGPDLSPALFVMVYGQTLASYTLYVL